MTDLADRWPLMGGAAEPDSICWKSRAGGTTSGRETSRCSSWCQKQAKHTEPKKIYNTANKRVQNCTSITSHRLGQQPVPRGECVIHHHLQSQVDSGQLLVLKLQYSAATWWPNQEQRQTASSFLHSGATSICNIHTHTLSIVLSKDVLNVVI